MKNTSRKKNTALNFKTGWDYAPAPESADHIKIKDQYELFINGKFVSPESGKYFDTINPAKETKIAKVADANNMLWVPGCMTPTEVIAAETLGAKMIKLFPGNIIGMAFMQAIKELFPDLLFMPTGGVDTTKENIEGWFKSGVCAVGMGSKLVTKSIMENKQYDELIAATKNVLAVISECRK